MKHFLLNARDISEAALPKVITLEVSKYYKQSMPVCPLLFQLYAKLLETLLDFEHGILTTLLSSSLQKCSLADQPQGDSHPLCSVTDW